MKNLGSLVQDRIAVEELTLCPGLASTSDVKLVMIAN